MRHDRVFNSHKSRLMRTRIPGSENLSVALIALLLIGLGAWVTTTRDDFDPTERDLAIELLGDNSRQIQIYNRPLKPWVEPGQQVAGAAFDLGPFPAHTLDDEWQPVGRVKRFQKDNLYEKINGEAEKFIKQGFVELAFLRLQSADDASEIAIELFDQGDLSGSLAVFSEHAAGRAVDHVVERRRHVAEEVGERRAVRAQRGEDEAAIAFHPRRLDHRGRAARPLRGGGGQRHGSRHGAGRWSLHDASNRQTDACRPSPVATRPHQRTRS